MFAFLLCTLSYRGFSQVGGQSSFEFLNVSSNARLSGLGGVNVSLADRDVNFFFSNPALVSDSLAGYASAGYQFYVADIGQAAFAYAHDFDKIGTLSFGVQHISYGELTGYDASGLEIGSFKSSETALVISKSHQVNNFRVGANFKTVFSSIAGFRSSALLLDIGGTFIHPTKNLTVGLVFKNLGFVLSEYSETSDTNVPFDVQVGATFKPEHMPLRFSLTAFNIATSGKAYDNPDDPDDNSSSFDKLLSHINIGTEILFHRNVNLLLAYNFLRQQELKTASSGGSGFCIGAAIKIRTFDIILSRNSYSVGNGAYSFTLSTNIQNMIFKKRSI
jgi:hypothetical protein